MEEFQFHVPVPGDQAFHDIVIIGCGREKPGGVDIFFSSVYIDYFIISKKRHVDSFPIP